MCRSVSRHHTPSLGSYDKLTGLAVAVQMTMDEEVQRNLLRLHGLNLMNNILREYEKDIHVITLVSLWSYGLFRSRWTSKADVQVAPARIKRRISKSSAGGNSKRETRSSRPRSRRTCRNV